MKKFTIISCKLTCFRTKAKDSGENNKMMPNLLSIELYGRKQWKVSHMFKPHWLSNAYIKMCKIFY